MYLFACWDFASRKRRPRVQNMVGIYSNTCLVLYLVSTLDNCFFSKRLGSLSPSLWIRLKSGRTWTQTRLRGHIKIANPSSHLTAMAVPSGRTRHVHPLSIANWFSLPRANYYSNHTTKSNMNVWEQAEYNQEQSVSTANWNARNLVMGGWHITY